MPAERGFFIPRLAGGSATSMSNRNNNKLPSNLPQLQNLIKRDPPAYVEEVGVRRGEGRCAAGLGSARIFRGGGRFGSP